MAVYPCGTETRRTAVRVSGDRNGIDYVEVRDTEPGDVSPAMRTLYLRLLQPVPVGLGTGQVRITGGERITDVAVTWAAPATALPVPAAEATEILAGLDEPDHVLVVRTDRAGDFSPYVLRFVAAPTDDAPPAGFDPLLVEVTVWFRIACPTDFDCVDADDDTTAPPADEPIDYRAKDYEGFRRLMLDRMATTAPAWTERQPADLGVMLVEVLAAVADQLSYRQDAVATEAYLGTARRRVSLRRHARLVDHLIGEGTNARVWVTVTVTAPVTLPARTPVLGTVPGLTAPALAPGSPELRRALAAGPVVFETVADTALDPDRALMSFWTWGEPSCTLPAGTTSATVKGHPPLAVGDVVVLLDGHPPAPDGTEDVTADRTCRFPVRLTAVRPTADPVGHRFDDVPSAGPVDVTDIEWDPVDALTVALCIRADAAERAFVRGNAVLADHGRTVGLTDAGLEPGGALGTHVDGERFRPALKYGPLTHAAPIPADAAATAALNNDPRAAVPALWVFGSSAPLDPYTVAYDLLDSGPGDRTVCVETESDGTATLRFGDGVDGRRPDSPETFTATYRVGNGVAGNVGIGTLGHVVTDRPAVTGVANLLPAVGGVDPETPLAIRRDAPEAFNVLDRAVTAADWAEVAGRTAGVQRAVASFRWTGSWSTVFLTADRTGGLAVDEGFRTDLEADLERYRLAGYDLEVDGPRYVPIELALLVCASPGYLRSDVARRVLRQLGNGRRADGTLALFHPDALTFGQPVYLSSVYAAVHAVPGVESATVTVFQRQRDPAGSGLATGVLDMGRLEIPRLDNSRDFPDRGSITLTLGGGT